MQFSEEQLKNKDFLEKLKKRASDILLYDEVTEAYHLAKNLEKSLTSATNFKENYFDFFKSYKKIIHRLKWIGLSIMTEEMAVDMFKKHFSEIYKIPDYELWQKLKIILLSIIVFEDRDKFKKELREALLDNKEIITSKKLLINKEEKDPTIGNWIMDYNSNLGVGVIDNLKRAQYFINNYNIKNLDSGEKEKIRILLDLYEQLKLSSLTLEGLEEDIPIDYEGREGYIRRGVFEPLPKFIDQQKLTQEIAQEVEEEREARENSIKELKESLNNFTVGSLERKAIEEELDKLESKEVRK